MQHQMSSCHVQPGVQHLSGAIEPTTHTKHLHDLCKRYHNHLMQIETTDGQVYDGIIDSVDGDGVTILIAVGDMEREDESQDEQNQRQFGYGPGYGGYGPGFGGYGPGFGGYGPGFGYGFPRRFRRFRRFHFPFFGLRRLFFPFFY